MSPTAIRELMLRELKHEHLIHLDSVHINRQARRRADRAATAAALRCTRSSQSWTCSTCRVCCQSCTRRHHWLLCLMQDPCLSLAFDYADHDLYGIISYHRERLRSAPISPFTVKSLMWQLLNGLSYLEQVRQNASSDCMCTEPRLAPNNTLIS